VTPFLQAAGVMGFGLAILSLGVTFYQRGQVSGRTVAAVEQSNANIQRMNDLLQEQALAMKEFGLGMKTQGEALREVATSFREFATKQAEVNQEMWQGIQIQSVRINSIAEQGCRYKENCP
jgi:methyl-accepting chemotaxis protein